ncbi:hypothetical protein J6590_074221 [Homalodisca vitripennis]|nr:hypothetical protein J6590_074221 [Homalodisca vitripennis]
MKLPASCNKTDQLFYWDNSSDSTFTRELRKTPSPAFSSSCRTSLPSPSTTIGKPAHCSALALPDMVHFALFLRVLQLTYTTLTDPLYFTFTPAWLPER